MIMMMNWWWWSRWWWCFRMAKFMKELIFIRDQWRRFHGARGARAPTFTNGWTRGGTPWVEEQPTRNWPNCTDHHESAHQNDQLCFRAKKRGKARPIKIFGAPHFCARPVPRPTFKFVPEPLNWGHFQGERVGTLFPLLKCLRTHSEPLRLLSNSHWLLRRLTNLKIRSFPTD